MVKNWKFCKNRISRFIINLQALMTSDAQGKKPMTIIKEMSKLEEVESKYRHQEYQNH